MHVKERSRFGRVQIVAHGWRSVILLVPLLLAAPAARAQLTYASAWWEFRAVEDSLIVDGEEYRESEGSTSVEISNPQSEGFARATATSSWGLGGVKSQVVTFGDVNLLTAGGEVGWEDTITIYGNLGVGTMPIEVWVTGTLAASKDGGAYITCALEKDYDTVGEIWREVSAEGDTASQNFVEVCGGVVEFEYGVPFVLSSYVVAFSYVPPVATKYEAYSGTAAAISDHTARLAVFDLPEGAWAETASGTHYPVPEPNAIHLFASAFATLAAIAWRSRRTAA